METGLAAKSAGCGSGMIAFDASDKVTLHCLAARLSATRVWIASPSSVRRREGSGANGSLYSNRICTRALT